MRRVRLVLGRYKSFMLTYDVFKLLYINGIFTSVFVRRFECTSAEVVKGSVYTLLKNDTDVFYFSDKSGNVHYYHPRYQKWYRNLDDKQKKIFFPWLVSV